MHSLRGFGPHLLAISIIIAAALGRPEKVLAITLSWDQADVIFTDEIRGLYGPLCADGDFNGDGQKDLVFVADQKAMIVLGEPLPPRAAMGTMVDWTIKLPTAIFSYVSVKSLLMADLNGDGKDDLIVGIPQIDFDIQGKVLVVFGRSGAGGTIDLTQTPADVEINGNSVSYLGKSLDVGDFNGDGLKDLLIGCQFNGPPEAYVLWGASNLSSSGMVLSTMSWAGSAQTEFVAAGDMNGDGKSDALITVNANGNRRSINVVWGSAPFLTTPQIQFQSSLLTVNRFFSPFVGNADGDSRSDVVLWDWNPVSGVGPLSVFLGAWISSGTVIGFYPNDPNYVPPVFLGTYKEPLVRGDFDGDGRMDVVGTDPIGSTKSPLRGFLSSAHPGVWQKGDTFASNFQVDLFEPAYLDTHLAMGDVNGDGRQDLVVARILNASPSQFLIFYGFVPLLNPRVEAAKSSGGARVTVDLFVDGDPSEMRLGGDILDSLRDQWIPFKSNQFVTLTPSPEEKTITAVFRNSLKRESDVAQAKITLVPGRTGVELISNRVRPNGRAVVECPMETAGRLRASVWSSDGNRVMDLVDEEQSPGVWTLAWDGRNADGKRVSPGVYIMHLEINGHVEEKKILVQG